MSKCFVYFGEPQSLEVRNDLETKTKSQMTCHISAIAQTNIDVQEVEIQHLTSLHTGNV